MSKEEKEEWVSKEERAMLKRFENHIWEKIKGEMIKDEFSDPRDDEMMSEIYPED